MESNSEQQEAVLKWLEEYLLKLRDRYWKYLFLLGKETEDILRSDYDSLKIHTEIDKETARGVLSLRKVIDPLMDLYRDFFPSGEPRVLQLEEEVSSLKEEVLKHNYRNRELLQLHMKNMKEAIASMRVPKRAFFSSNPPRYVDIMT